MILDSSKKIINSFKVRTFPLHLMQDEVAIYSFQSALKMKICV